jgi:septum formation protein
MMSVMYQPISTVYLASGSPRRRFLLESCGLVVKQIAQDADETWPSMPLGDAMEELARRKMGAIHSPIPGLTVSADTAVILDGKALGKPADTSEATETITMLSGRSHTVASGVCVADGKTLVSFHVLTQVWFRPLSTYEIATYVGLGESMDKAGAYGIQGHGASLVDRIEGSYTNVVGLPVAETLAALRVLG